MKRLSIFFAIAMLACMALASAANAYEIVIRPQEAIVEPGAGMKFEAQAFNSNSVPVAVQSYTWKVVPEDLGEITDDGYFMAGREPGKGEIIATAVIGGQRYAGTAHVKVGAPSETDVKIIIEPQNPMVVPGGKVQFKAIAMSREGVSLRARGVRWMVEPETLGRINNKGLFQAGNTIGRGHIIALVEIDHQLYRGETRLIVSPRPSARISGIVTDENGEPLANARVSASLIGEPRLFREARADSNGAYTLEKLIPGAYLVRAAAKGFVPEYYEEAEYPAAAMPVRVHIDEEVTDINFTLAPGGAISGLVVADETGELLKGVHVVAWKPLAPNHKFHTLTDENGNYILDGLSSGAYVVAANVTGYEREFYDNVKREIDATFVSVTAPNETPGIDFSLAIKAALKGLVTDEQGNPIPRALVLVKKKIDASLDAARYAGKAVTNADGEYAVQLSPGTYIVLATAKDYVEEWYEDAATPAEADPVVIVEDEHTIIDFQLAHRGTIAGSVIDEQTGEAIAGAKVKAFAEFRGHRRYFSTLTGEDGTYEFSGLPQGKFIIAACAEDYLIEFWEEADSVKNADIVEVVNGVAIGGIDFTLLKAGAIAGVVLNGETNEAVPGAVIVAKKVNSLFMKKTRAGDNGEYKLDGLPKGEYIVAARAKGFYKQFYLNADTIEEADEVAVEPATTTPDIDFALKPIPVSPTGITGIVLDDSTGLPIEGAVVVVVPLTWARPKMAVTGPDGMYELLGLKPGLYLALCIADGYAGEYYDNTRRIWKAKPLRITQDNILEDIDFGLAPREEGAYMIAGQIIGADGQPIEGALVVAEDGDVVVTDVTDETGAYQMTNVPAGDYTITASVAGYEESNADAAVGGGENATSTTLSLSKSTSGAGSESTLPNEFLLQQNYPNPFNPATEISFTLPMDAQVRLTIYNVLGKQIKTLVNENRAAGSYSVLWNGKDENGTPMASGVYLYQIDANAGSESFSSVRRMIMVK